MIKIAKSSYYKKRYPDSFHFYHGFTSMTITILAEKIKPLVGAKRLLQILQTISLVFKLGIKQLKFKRKRSFHASHLQKEDDIAISSVSPLFHVTLFYWFNDLYSWLHSYQVQDLQYLFYKVHIQPPILKIGEINTNLSWKRGCLSKKTAPAERTWWVLCAWF